MEVGVHGRHGIPAAPHVVMQYSLEVGAARNPYLSTEARRATIQLPSLRIALAS